LDRKTVPRISYNKVLIWINMKRVTARGRKSPYLSWRVGSMVIVGIPECEGGFYTDRKHPGHHFKAWTNRCGCC
jgi:hypothetical protein